MQITVRLFATLRQQAGWKENSIDVPSGATVGDVLRHLEQTYAPLHLVGRSLYAAVNQEYAQLDQVLQPGDEVALFPPVSGGCSVASI